MHSRIHVLNLIVNPYPTISICKSWCVIDHDHKFQDNPVSYSPLFAFPNPIHLFYVVLQTTTHEEVTVFQHTCLRHCYSHFSIVVLTHPVLSQVSQSQTCIWPVPPKKGKIFATENWQRDHVQNSNLCDVQITTWLGINFIRVHWGLDIILNW